METAIICTTFNRSEQLKRTVWSITNQDYPLDKTVLIIIDDGSVDNTRDVLKPYIDGRITPRAS